jgi:two-component system sensor histidine kinase/response regulator
MNEKRLNIFTILNTPLKVALVSLALSEIITEGIIWSFGLVEFALPGFIIAGICGFSIAYGTSYVIFGYQKVIEEKNRQLETLSQELQAANALLTTKNAELDARNAELNAFARTVAHDLKSPMTAILGLSKLLVETHTQVPSEVLADKLQTIAKKCDMMVRIIDELLLLSSVRYTEEIPLSPLDMGSIVSEAQDRLGYMIEEYMAEIILPESWPVALGYGPWVEQIWTNYLSNAIKYGGQPPCVELGATEQPDGFVRFWVRDNGTGLAPEKQVQLFAPFTQLHRVQVKGHGLGLSIVQHIVDKLGGQVGVESKLGQGSTFTFTLPGVQQQSK